MSRGGAGPCQRRIARPQCGQADGMLHLLVCVSGTTDCPRGCSNFPHCEVGKHACCSGVLRVVMPGSLVFQMVRIGRSAARNRPAFPAVHDCLLVVRHRRVPALVASNSGRACSRLLHQVRLQPHRQRQRHLPRVRGARPTVRPTRGGWLTCSPCLHRHRHGQAPPAVAGGACPCHPAGLAQWPPPAGARIGTGTRPALFCETAGTCERSQRLIRIE